MSEQLVHTFELPNGLTLLIEPMADVQSAAFSLLVPGGSLYDPVDQAGCASVLVEMLLRGAGSRDSEALTNALDNLGLQRHEAVGRQHISFQGATLAENLPESLRIYADIVRRPTLPAKEFKAAVNSCAQSLLAIEDDPYDKTMVELRKMCFPAPWGNPSDGTIEGLSHLGMKSIKEHFKRCYRPNGAILGIAGKVDVAEIQDLVQAEFGDWATQPEPEYLTGPRGPYTGHIEQESDQIHLALAYDSVPCRHPDYYTAWAANWVLGGGSSARLFTEVRERRGLCYSVHSQLTSTRDDGRVLCHAGVTSDRAQEALGVILQEILRLPGSIQENELNRCKAGVKSELIMQQESSSSRAAGLSNDWFHLGRVVSLDELRQKIEGLTVNSLHEHLERHPPRDFTILTLGPRPVEVPHAIP